MATTYAEWAPTGLDPKGAYLPKRQDWLVVPVSHTRDSGPLDESNFEAALKLLGGEGAKIEVHRFGHWGPGWIEIILAHPSKAKKVEEIEASLGDYPVLDDEDLSSREFEAFGESWSDWGERELVEKITAYADVEDDEKDEFEEAASGADLKQWWIHHANEPYITEDSGVYIDFGQFDRIPAKAKDALVRAIGIKAGLIAKPAASEVGEPLFRYAKLNPRKRRRKVR